jgi:hypothetical protein
LTQIEGKSINTFDFFLKFVISVKGDNCDYWPRVPQNLATPLLTRVVTNPVDCPRFASGHQYRNWRINLENWNAVRYVSILALYVCYYAIQMWLQIAAILNSELGRSQVDTSNCRKHITNSAVEGRTGSLTVADVSSPASFIEVTDTAGTAICEIPLNVIHPIPSRCYMNIRIPTGFLYKTSYLILVSSV